MHFLLAEGYVTLLAGAFQLEMGMRFSRGHHEMDCFLFTVELSVTECRKLIGTDRNNVWNVAANVRAHDLTIFVTQQNRYIVAIIAEGGVRCRVTDRCSSEQQEYDSKCFINLSGWCETLCNDERAPYRLQSQRQNFLVLRRVIPSVKRHH